MNFKEKQYKEIQNSLTDVNISELKAVLNHKGAVLCGVGESENKNATSIAVKKALDDECLKNHAQNKIQAVFIHFLTPPNHDIVEIVEAMEIIHSIASDAEIFWAKSTNLSVGTNSVKVTLILNIVNLIPLIYA
jgi:cell division GTPase FtsZ